VGGKWRKVRTQAELEKVIEAGDFAEIVAAGHFTASDSATVTAYDSATVTAYDYVAVHRLSKRAKVTGGVQIAPPDLTTTDGWLAYYGLTPKRGYVTLYKGLNDSFVSGYGTSYKPGEKPSAPDWNPQNECGGGLHLSPRAHLTLNYGGHTRFVAVKVKVADIVPIGTEGASDKCKVPTCTVLHEVDVDGNPIEVAA
jgi:hypothetical protein